MLCDWANYRLMIRRCVDRRQFVCASWKAFSNVRRKDTALSSSIQAKEERELLGIVRIRLVQRSEWFNDNVRVADDLTLAVELLRCGEVVCLCIHEITGLHTLDRHFDGERLVNWHRPEVVWEDKLGRGHVSGCRDLSHGCRVTGSCFDLLAIGDGLLCGETEVDEVVGRRQ
jgi:hypothetical protein